MKEFILHYVWQSKLFFPENIKTTNGLSVEVVDVGLHNADAGPDFFNAKIKIDGVLWAGNVEIHTRSSDWNKHNHQHDKAYRNVILHVVKHADTEVYTSGGSLIPQIELTYPDYINKNYESLSNARLTIPCSDKVADILPLLMKNWLDVLLVERLMQKTASISLLLKQTEQNWEEAFYVMLARHFGFGKNNQVFERLAKSLPLKILAKHKNDLFQLEALLLGQSGLLNQEVACDDYSGCLLKEYRFLKSKYDLQTIDFSQWKMLRLRPDNFPQLRLAQLSALIHQSSKLFSKILEKDTLAEIRSLFMVETSGYWKTHYTFSHESPSRSKKIGASSIDAIIINVVVPFLFLYARRKNRVDLEERAINFLSELPVENNSIVSEWKTIGVKAETAYDSQALIQLKKEYCDLKKCLRCRIGHKILQIQ